MARQFLILALVFFAIVGMASAAATTADEHATSSVPADGPVSDNVIGTMDGAGEHEAAPVGGPVASGAFATGGSTDAPSGSASDSGAAALHVSAGAGLAAAVAATAFFY